MVTKAFEIALKCKHAYIGKTYFNGFKLLFWLPFVNVANDFVSCWVVTDIKCNLVLILFPVNPYEEAI